MVPEPWMVLTKQPFVLPWAVQTLLPPVWRRLRTTTEQLLRVLSLPWLVLAKQPFVLSWAVQTLLSPVRRSLSSSVTLRGMQWGTGLLDLAPAKALVIARGTLGKRCAEVANFVQEFFASSHHILAGWCHAQLSSQQKALS